MGLTFNESAARKGDTASTVLKESGKYVGIITRAEKLLSRNNVEGVGLSFKSDEGSSASYLDVYTVKANGEQLWGYNLIQSLICCLRLKTVDEGPINFERWDRDSGGLVAATATGYPSMIGKRIGVLLQKELGTNQNTGADTERLNLIGVFEASSGLTATEIIEGKTKGERMEAKLKWLMANPIRDSRKNKGAAPETTVAKASAPFDDDIPF